MTHWHAVKTKPHKEEQVFNLLSQGGFPCFYPRLRELSWRNGERSFLVKPLFPTYLFLRTDFSVGRNLHLVKYTRGVAHVLHSGGMPMTIPDAAIEMIRSRANADGVVAIGVSLKDGQKVRVKRGVLKDLEGILQAPSPEEARVRVLLNLANYTMSATLHVSEIESLKG